MKRVPLFLLAFAVVFACTDTPTQPEFDDPGALELIQPPSLDVSTTGNVIHFKPPADLKADRNDNGFVCLVYVIKLKGADILRYTDDLLPGLCRKGQLVAVEGPF